MKQLRGDKDGGRPRKKGSSSGKDGSTPAVQTSDDSGQINILNPRLLAQKRPLQDLSSMGGSTAGSVEDAKRPKLLPEVNSPGQESEDEESDDSDYERAESDNDVSDDTSSEEEDDDDEETGSDASESSNEGPEETTNQPSSRPDLTKEWSSMSFEELLQLRNRVGTKAYQQMTTGKRAANVTRTAKRQYPNKHGPLEISAKKPVPFLRRVVPVKKKLPRDPRFDDLSGEYKPEVFEKTYAFLNDIRKKEKEVVQKQLKKSKNVEQQSKLQQLLKQMTQQEEVQRRRQREREKDLALKRQQRELAQQGKKPFYLKKSEKRKWELAEKYQELKKSGKLESFLSKKWKRNAAKDKRRLPFSKDV
ncbi:ribosomal RNA processing protein 36 homolog isoform X1 [Rhineura floridana]|uniref:ribosomal RNA processing protein 36 homolog isoform X1 n=1 Tax=Rhineura floridana TaxID=261503 RepID=UPI002AC7F645|nr:ribosomal RNA processing protein 36 homolog isoform X1 [Rhineura floridana]XP_061481487.1 ribosomal RNA processing protein 36 homolog isoform X1 [Rhineura floridana]XP_061481488.1 ribosomal RNA processing protein 36 homolog isoform X1 [Rhineura floridana]